MCEQGAAAAAGKMRWVLCLEQRGRLPCASEKGHVSNSADKHREILESVILSRHLSRPGQIKSLAGTKLGKF